MSSDSRFRPFLERLRGLSEVRRWNFHPHHTHETVAEHSFYVASYAVLMCMMDGNYSLLQEIALSALVHDYEEALTGDLPMLVKREVKAPWDVVEEKGFQQLVGTLPVEMMTAYSNWKQVTGLTIQSMATVKKYVKAADMLDVLIYCRIERLKGNTYFKEIEQEASTLLRRMDMPSLNVILDEYAYPKFEHSAVELPADMTHL